MRILSKAACGGLILAGFIPAAGTVRAADSAASEPLRFKFELNHPLVYSLASTTQTTTERSVQLDTGIKSAATTNSVGIRYKFRLTPVRKLPDGTWTLHYEPFDFEEDLDTSASGGHAVTSIRGLDVTSTQNGIAVVDTGKGVGLGQAKAIKQGIYPRMLSGYFDFQPNGVISKVDGDLPFIDYWGETIKYQIGFFDIILPPDAVPAGGSWIKTLAVKDLEGIKLGASGILETNTFVRQPEASAGGHLISVAVNMAVDPKNLLGSMDTLGQSTTLNISDFNHQKTGKFQFDAETGCLATSEENETVKMTMDMLVQGHTMNVATELNIQSKIALVPN